MKLQRYSFGVGDRFGCQGRAQLEAFVRARDAGVAITPVWNKSHREHRTVKTRPESVREEADAAVAALGWTGPYHVDADHVGLETIDAFIAPSDFFTIDVADFIGRPAERSDVAAYVARYRRYTGFLEIPGIPEALSVSPRRMEEIAGKFLLASKAAGKVYRRIEAAKGAENFITEVSMDETDMPQTPVELFFILAALADEGIPAQAIAPKFTGRFNKGVDYAGDIARFRKEFEEDLAVIDFAVREFGLPEGLKLSVHSGSDKFSIYEPMGRALRRTGAGLHLKTAGTTWLEELIGLAAAGGEGLAIAREVYRIAFGRYDELCAPYAAVIDIDRRGLPDPGVVDGWSGEEFGAALRHDPSCDRYNPNLRQLLHVGYKVAAEMGARYRDALKEFEEPVARNVTENIFERHIKRLFMDG